MPPRWMKFTPRTKNNKFTNNEFTSAAAEAKAHELLRQTRNKESRNTSGKNSISVRRTVGSTTVGHGEKLYSQLPHQSTHVKELTCTNKIR